MKELEEFKTNRIFYCHYNFKFVNLKEQALLCLNFGKVTICIENIYVRKNCMIIKVGSHSGSMSISYQQFFNIYNYINKISNPVILINCYYCNTKFGKEFRNCRYSVRKNPKEFVFSFLEKYAKKC